MERTIVIGLSGGMDSATLLGYFLGQGFAVHACSFAYGSKHSPYELNAAESIVEYYRDRGYNIKHSYFDLKQPFQIFKSNLLQSGGEIPEGHYEEESMKQTVVPGRNLIMSAIMAGVAESEGAQAIGLGVHAGDHHIYPDCRPGFINSLKSTLNASTEGKVSVLAPFLDLDKHKILKIGYTLTPQVPYHLTRTCYKAQEISCGKCGSCRERLEAFANLGINDPIKYEQ